MKKRILIVLVVAAALFAFAGCSGVGKKADTFGMVANEKSSISVLGTKADFDALTAKDPEAFGVCVTLPVSYQNEACECVAGDDEIGGFFMQFTDAQNKKADCGGHLFTLHMIPAGKTTEFAQYELIGKITKDGKAVYDLVKEIPSDVQYDLQDQKLTDSYKSMFDEAKTVIDSVALSEGYTLEKK